MTDFKIPIALAAAMAAQLAAGVWWVSQQAAIIADLEGTVAQMSSRMAIESQVNLKRDVKLNAEHLVNLEEDIEGELDDLWEDVDDLWDEYESMMMHISAINQVKQRIAAIETELRYIGRDHQGMIDLKGMGGVD